MHRRIKRIRLYFDDGKYMDIDPAYCPVPDGLYESEEYDLPAEDEDVFGYFHTFPETYNNMMSKRIRYILMVLDLVRFMLTDDSFGRPDHSFELPLIKKALAKSMKTTGKRNCAAVASINDKLTRGCSTPDRKIEINDWLPILRKWLTENDPDEIVEILVRAVSHSRYWESDIKAVAGFFGKTEDEIIEIEKRKRRERSMNNGYSE